jgi:uncharacterized C2H2 Zn-finger protein
METDQNDICNFYMTHISENQNFLNNNNNTTNTILDLCNMENDATANNNNDAKIQSIGTPVSPSRTFFNPSKNLFNYNSTSYNEVIMSNATNTSNSKMDKNDSKKEKKKSNPSKQPVEKNQVEKSKRRVHRYCPKSKNQMEFILECEWNQCKEAFTNMDMFINHIDKHLDAATASTSPNLNNFVYDEEITENNFECQWTECSCIELNSKSMLQRHVLFHAFHAKLKDIGKNVLESLNTSPKLPQKNELNPENDNDEEENVTKTHLTRPESLSKSSLKVVKCTLDEQTRNTIPELPFKFKCSWSNCLYNANNPEVFYKHIHDEHIVKMKTKDFTTNPKCFWGECEQRLANKNRLSEHIRHHSQEKLVACPNCGALFASVTKFIDHCTRTSGDMQNLCFQCSHCNKKFATHNLLKEHVRKHINRKKCPICDMTCIDKNDLRKHILYKHTDLKAYQCPSCEYSCKCELDLQKHISLKHTERSEYQCNVCDFKSKDLIVIKRHMLKNHLNKEDSLMLNDGQNFSSSYICHVCSKVYSQSVTLSRHLKKIHSIQLPSGHTRFKYRLDADGYHRLQTLRYESLELSEQLKRTKDCENLAASNNMTQPCTSNFQASQSDQMIISNTTDNASFKMTDFDFEDFLKDGFKIRPSSQSDP